MRGSARISQRVKKGFEEYFVVYEDQSFAIERVSNWNDNMISEREL
jgi:hypothetical protein